MPPASDPASDATARQATILLLPPPPNPRFHQATWNRLPQLPRLSSHTSDYGDYLEELGLATPRSNDQQTLTLYHLDVAGNIGWVRFDSAVRAPAVVHAGTRVELPSLIVGRDVLDSCTLSGRQDGFWCFAWSPAGHNELCSWGICVLDEALPGARASIAATLADAEDLDRYNVADERPRLPTHGGGMRFPTPAPANPPTLDVDLAVSILLLPAPFVPSLSSALWNRGPQLPRLSWHTRQYGVLLERLQLAEPEQHDTQQLTLYHIDVNGVIGWVRFDSRIRHPRPGPPAYSTAGECIWSSPAMCCTHA